MYDRTTNVVPLVYGNTYHTCVLSKMNDNCALHWYALDRIAVLKTMARNGR